MLHRVRSLDLNASDRLKGVIVGAGCSGVSHVSGVRGCGPCFFFSVEADMLCSQGLDARAARVVIF